MNRLVVLVAAAVSCLAPVGCTTNPATGKSQFNLISEQQEVSLGMQSGPQFLREYGGDVPSAEVMGYVRGLGQELVSVGERPSLPWEFHVVDSTDLNAFALPGGKVFITRGLMSKLDNEAQLAGVLGHECGHVNAQHIGQQMTRAIGLQVVAVGLGVAGEASDKDYLRVLGAGTQVGGTVYLLKFGRDQESQADELGVRYMTKLGYSPVAQIQVMEVLKKAMGSGSPGIAEMLSTHPLPETRIQRLEEHITANYPQYKNPAAYRFNRDQYHQRALIPLSKLPAARHHSEGPSADGKALALAGYYCGTCAKMHALSPGPTPTLPILTR